MISSLGCVTSVIHAHYRGASLGQGVEWEGYPSLVSALSDVPKEQRQGNKVYSALLRRLAYAKLFSQEDLVSVQSHSVPTL